MAKLKITIFNYAYINAFRIPKVRACFFVIKLSFKWPKKIEFFFCSGHMIKNMRNKDNKKTFFTSSEDRMYITVSGIIIFGIKWKTNLFDKAKKIQIKIIIQSKNIPLSKGNEKCKISQTTVKDIIIV